MKLRLQLLKKLDSFLNLQQDSKTVCIGPQTKKLQDQFGNQMEIPVEVMQLVKYKLAKADDNAPSYSPVTHLQNMISKNMW